MRSLVILRPEPGASASLDRARAMGLEASALPLFEIVAVDWQAPDPQDFDAILMTSANAARCAGDRLRHYRRLPVYAVGEATAAEARAAGLSVAAVGRGAIEDLLPLIPAKLRLLHFCGERRRQFDPGDRTITPLVVYRAEPLPVANLASALEGKVAAVHSPAAGARIADLVTGKDRQSIRIAAISPAAAQAAGIGWSAVEFAQVPSDEALLALAARLCEEDGRQ